MILPLRYYGDPILRKRAQPIEKITDEIRQLSLNMAETMVAAKGIGLAGNQIGVLLRVFVSNVDYEDEQGELHLCEAKVYINPEITAPSEAIVECNEACLSIPGLKAPVIRPLSIILEYTDLEGNRLSQKNSGYPARCFMHETDHLNGKLFIDRIKGKKRRELDPQLRLIKQEYYNNLSDRIT